MRDGVSVEVEAGGLERTGLAFVPEGVGLAPLVLAFHGKGGSSEGAAKMFKLHEEWPEALVIYPQGLATANRLDPEGTRSGWQPRPGDLDDRDLLFVDGLLARYSGAYDPARVYAMGHSNGGRFTYVLWAARPSVFAALAPSSSSIGPLAKVCVPKPVFVAAGEKDRVVPFQAQLKAFEAIRGTGAELELHVHPGGHEYRKGTTAPIVEFFKRFTL